MMVWHFKEIPEQFADVKNMNLTTLVNNYNFF